VKPTHRKNDRAWRPAPKAWHYRKFRVWPKGATTSHILKQLWPQGRISNKSEKILEPPHWAALARERHWMSENAFHRTPKVWLGKMSFGFLDMPFLRVIRKGVAW
jgi:hypothetical protein